MVSGVNSTILRGKDDSNRGEIGNRLKYLVNVPLVMSEINQGQDRLMG